MQSKKTVKMNVIIIVFYTNFISCSIVFTEDFKCVFSYYEYYPHVIKLFLHNAPFDPPQTWGSKGEKVIIVTQHQDQQYLVLCKWISCFEYRRILPWKYLKWSPSVFITCHIPAYHIANFRKSPKELLWMGKSSYCDSNWKWLNRINKQNMNFSYWYDIRVIMIYLQQPLFFIFMAG